ncbi:MAG: cupin domain-containing protein [Bdellovibrionaceae bacterium]|nr:cupin domain-containing protein [Pseudobdellovibrionaceae bacterium]
MEDRPGFIKSCEELRTDESFNYPGDTEIFGTGAAISRNLGLSRVAVNYEVLKPGDRSSWPHAHKEEEEFILVLEGTPQIWVDGEVYDLNPGDCVGLPPGTGNAHCLINNSDKDVRSIVVGEIDVKGDKIFYPKHPSRNQECKDEDFFWEGHPEHELGMHDGWPDKKRPIQE